jgi:tol-pal system protein YbgF
MIHRLLIVACFCTSLFSVNAWSDAAVVDESENYALLEEQPSAYQSPVAHDDTVPYEYNGQNNNQALAREEPVHNASGNTSTDNASLLNKVLGLQQEIQELRGQLEVQSHELKLLRDQQLSLYKDLDARLRNEPVTQAAKPAVTPLDLDTKPVPPQTTSQSSPAAPVIPAALPAAATARGNPADEQISYLAAYELVKNKHFNEALAAMQAFAAKYPHGGYTANAQYWIGELYMVKADYTRAIEHFNTVLQAFPSSSKCAASMLKTGYALAASGKTMEARTRLQEVIKTYPDTSTAKLAAAKLSSLTN